MCRYCNFAKIGGEVLNPAFAADMTCDWFFEESGDYCSVPAAYIVENGYVEDHLCNEHIELVKKQFRDALRKAGHKGKIRSPFKLFKLEEGEMSCDFHELELGFCGNPATFARFVESMQFYCPNHARSSGYLAAED